MSILEVLKIISLKIYRDWDLDRDLSIFGDSI